MKLVAKEGVSFTLNAWSVNVGSFLKKVLIFVEIFKFHFFPRFRTRVASRPASTAEPATTLAISDTQVPFL
jgi:hypothetical protein